MIIALCNEVLAEMPFERQCEFAAATGYDGLELAPFTLSSNTQPWEEIDASDPQGCRVSRSDRDRSSLVAGCARRVIHDGSGSGSL